MEDFDTKYAKTVLRTINWELKWQNSLEKQKFSSAIANKSDCLCGAPYIIQASNVANKNLGCMEYITQNDYIITIYECSEFYMDFKKAFHIVSAEWER